MNKITKKIFACVLSLLIMCEFVDATRRGSGGFGSSGRSFRSGGFSRGSRGFSGRSRSIGRGSRSSSGRIGRSRAGRRGRGSRVSRSIRTTKITRTTVRSMGFRMHRGRGVFVGGRHFGAFRSPYARAFWGHHFFVHGVGCWFYPTFGFWYSPVFGCWYLPWSYCWYFPHYWYWYYPRDYFSIVYVHADKKEPAEKVILVENKQAKNLFFSVYVKDKEALDDGGYYLYRVREPEVISDARTLRVSIPPDEQGREFVVLASRDQNDLPVALIQDKNGEVKKLEGEPVRTLDEDNRPEVFVGDPERKDIRYLEGVKSKVEGKYKRLDKTTKGIEKIKTPPEEEVGA